MTRRGWLLFAVMSVVWGAPYLFIHVAVRDVSPPVLVAARTAIGAVLLLPFAVRRHAIRPALTRWRPLLAFVIVEMAGPWLFLADAERHLPSGLTGLLIASVPLIATIVAVALGERAVTQPVRVVGLVVGLVGVMLLVGFGDLGGGGVRSVGEVLLVAIGYAVGPFIISRRLSDVPSIGVVAVSLAIVAVAYLPIAYASRPSSVPSAQAFWSLIGLGVLCTAIAFMVFFELIDAVGPARATLITFVNPIIAVMLGIAVLSESITVGLVVGSPLILFGCWLAARPIDEAVTLIVE